MSTKNISYIAIISIVFILLTQSYLVYDYFQTVRFALIRESDAILKEAFRNELNQRNTYVSSMQSDSVPQINDVDTDGGVMDFDMRETGGDEESILNRLDIMLHVFISKLVPINL